MKIVHNMNFQGLISLENLFANWEEFRKNKAGKIDVMAFESNLEDNLFLLYEELGTRAYRHGAYQTFHIFDPKHRVISKAPVRDRVVHHLVFKKLYEIFNPIFIYHSYASRIDKGSHLAVRDLAEALRKESWHFKRKAFALKCDIRKFFDSVSHKKLLQIIENKIKDSQFLELIREIVQSFSVDKIGQGGGTLSETGLPISNVTSQIFANIYLNELDQFVKHGLGAKYYFRYADDFVIVSDSENYLHSLREQVRDYLKTSLDLEIHPRKNIIRKFRQGIDFLGYVVLPHRIVLRTKTKRRIFRKLWQNHETWQRGEIDERAFHQSIQSYLGILKHCKGYDLSTMIKNNFLRQ